MKEFRRNAFPRFLICLMAGLVWLLFPVKGFAAETEAEYVNESTGYGVYIDDGADLLTDTEEKSVMEIMKPITEYGNIIYLTTERHNYAETGEYVEKYYLSNFGPRVSGIVYCIDNDLGYDYVYSEGDAYDIVGRSFALTITDNVYMYSTNKQWCEGASAAFTLIYDVLEGKRIAQPMKYICNALLALLLGFLICFLIVNSKSKLKSASAAELVEGSMRAVKFEGVEIQHINQTRRYSPKSSSSGGGGSHGGGGGGGGGHHGGGGGHAH